MKKNHLNMVSSHHLKWPKAWNSSVNFRKSEQTLLKTTLTVLLLLGTSAITKHACYMLDDDRGRAKKKLLIKCFLKAYYYN